MPDRGSDSYAARVAAQVEAAPLIEIAAVFTDSAGIVFTNASGMTLSWQVSRGNATLKASLPDPGALLLQSTLQQIYTVPRDVMVAAGEQRVQVRCRTSRRIRLRAGAL